MRYALTAELSRLAERRAEVEAGLALGDLMRRAGAAVAERVNELFPAGRVVVLCGKGNNGGDGWVAAQRLVSFGREVSVLSLAVPTELGDPAASAAAEAVERGTPWSPVDSVPDLAARLAGAAVIVDAVFGIGFGPPVREPVASILAAVADANAPIIAIDVPSGVDADTGAADATALPARATVTFSALKPGLLLYPGAELAGDVMVVDIGVPGHLLALPNALELWDIDEYAPLLPIPGAEAHKGERGRVLVVGGSVGMTGAPCMAAAAALRMGAGVVKVAVAASLADIVEIKLTEVMTAPLSEDGPGRFGLQAAEEAVAMSASFDAVVLGPGLSTADGKAVRRAVLGIERPLVLDADGLAPFAGCPSDLAARASPTVITPHPGEAARLLGGSVGGIQADRPAAVRALARGGVTCLLKGAGTLASNGERTVVNTTGNPGMATAGTGDVLSGMIATLLAQGVEPLEAAALGAWLHGRAGDAAAEELTQTCLTAGDIIRRLPAAVASLHEETV